MYEQSLDRSCASNSADTYDFPWSAELLHTTNFWTKVRNTFLTPHWLWPLVVDDQDCDAVMRGELTAKTGWKRLTDKVLRRLVWFWPRIVEARVWVNERSDPSNFRELAEDSRHLVDEVARVAGHKDAPILDIGCNCGRHLAALADMGFTNLHGVDIGHQAISMMDTWFPQLKGVCSAEIDLMQRFLSRCDERTFDVIFTRGATVELIHPSYPLVKNLCRVTRSHVVLMIRENAHAYPRFWVYEFARHGFLLTKLIRPVQQIMKERSPDLTYVSLLVFRRKP